MRHILYLTGQSVSLFAADRRGAHARGRFSLDEAGFQQLREVLARMERRPVPLLVDLIEEEFREESLPHANGRDRARLHERHAGKLFRTTPFRQSRVVGRQREGRRDDRVLFSALTNRDNIEPLLELLNELAIPLAGIHSLPVVSRHLLKPLQTRSENVLIITGQPDGGLRETFMRENRVLFSRLAPINDTSPQSYCEIVTAEASKTQRYLHTLRLLPRDAALDVFALTDAARVEALKQGFVPDGKLECHPVMLSQIAQLCGYADFPDTHLSDALFCYLLNKYSVANHYAKPSHLARLRTYQFQVGANLATWLVAVGAAALLGTNIVDGRLAASEAQQVAAAARQVDAGYQQLSERLPIEPVAARAMREAIQVADTLEAGQIDIAEILERLGAAFSRQPNLELRNLDWFASADPAGATPAALDSGRDGPLSLSPARYVISDIKGQLKEFDGSYSRAHRQVDELVAWLSRQPGVTDVVVTRKPLNVKADAEVQGETGKTDKLETAQFELRVVMELGHGRV
ncbi:MAG: hypothetical protein J5I92_09390 [Thiogranum sp.]|nr:hypothetical protein [Thiogranum sp.]